MQVQDRTFSKPSKPATHPGLSKTRRIAAAAASCSLYKIAAAALIAASVAALFLLRRPAAAFCSATPVPRRAPYPQIRWDSIPAARSPADPYASFRSDRWIVASVSSHPSAPLRRLARTKGWQLLAVGNSRTPSDWSLKGALFLPLDLQTQLGLRSPALLPYNSYLRKSAGYLFAIQHGARFIFDADDRSDLIADLSSHFDLDLDPSKNPLPLLQYLPRPNRTVLNPYVHFGQRSVWPRGLPLASVGEVAHEEAYGEVSTGAQFIQLGLSNGLPDVDSFFYFTRKSTSEVFDIHFDEKAPKIALPQGTMVPVNSFNTLFLSQAFWGLMLPISLSSMASDVIRGYWAQRILWEIGGFVAVYPPTIHRLDDVESYPFSEEKDLHVNVGHLIEFLVSWRSDKPSLFERILHLSYAMAEEGFWSEQDVAFTAAWLQDLIAVGYQQPRLTSLELDRPKSSLGIKTGALREFIPRKLPSVHLGVEEAETVNYEIGNLIRWRNNFGNVVLILHCSGPVDRTALEWRLLYGRIFKTVVILSEHSSPDLVVEYAQLAHAYKYLPKVFEKFAGAEGFLFLQDDMILNYWNLLQADKTKLWITNKVPQSWVTVPIKGNSSQWLAGQVVLVKKVIDTFPVHFQVRYKESVGEERLIVCSSEIFYVPRRFVGDFIDLVGMVGDSEIHHKVAVPMFFLAMDSLQNFEPDALARIVYRTEANASSFGYYNALAPAVYPLKVQSESDFVKLVRNMASGDPLLMELV